MTRNGNRITFDTSAFMPARGRRGYQPNRWQRFTLLMTEEQEQAMRTRSEEIWEQESRDGTTSKGRRFDRSVVKRFGIR